MTRIAILGGGIAGLTAAYELELARKRGVPLDWQLYEASDRLGGILATERRSTAESDYVLEGGPDAWVSDKPWARELAIELGLESELISSNDAARKTYILIPEEGASGKLQPMPDRMRMMVPEDLGTLDSSPLFTASAKQACADELARADELRAAAPREDESVASFVLRHFGPEVLEKIAAPLLSGVFGGDVNKLSVQSVMAPFVAMEREHGSLILALQTRKRERGDKPPQPIFTTLKRGMGSLVEAIVATLPPERLHLNTPVKDIGDENRWYVFVDELEGDKDMHPKPLYGQRFDQVILATPLDVTRSLLTCVDCDNRLQDFLPAQASSAVLATFCWPAESARTFGVPPGFGFLVSHSSASAASLSSRPERSGVERPAVRPANPTFEPTLLAATFIDQKFLDRAPAGARVLRAFFGGTAAVNLQPKPDETIAAAALHELESILGPLPAPDPMLTAVWRWPRSLPQYEVGHLDRMAQLDDLVAHIPGLHLLGNSYRGVGVPDLIRDARNAARAAAAAPAR